MESMDDDKNDSSPLLPLEPPVLHDVQFVMYFKLTSRKDVIKSQKTLQRIDEMRVMHSLLRTTLEQAGLSVVEMWKSDDTMKYHWGITASESRLRAHADKIHYELRLKKEYGGGMAPYYASQHQLFEVSDESLFDELDRQRLVTSIIHSPNRMGGAQINIESLFRDKLLYKFFPLHDVAKQEHLMKEWVTKPWRTQPVNHIRAYFGEKVAYYFGFMGYCIKWLLPISILGLANFIIQQFASVNYSYIGSLVWSILMPLWATLFIEFWKRKSIARAVRWGMDKMEIKEESRPSYSGYLRVGVWWGKNWIDLKEMAKRDKSFHRLNIYEEPSHRLRRAVLSSWPILGGMMLLSLSIAFFFIMLSSLFAHVSGLSTFISVINGFVIVVLSIIYRKIAAWVTEHENHRTETDAEDSVIIKVFIFDFLNAFGTIFYQAFLRYNVNWASTNIPWMSVGACSNKTPVEKFECVLNELQALIVSLFLVRIFFFQLLDFIIPYLNTKLRVWWTRRRIINNKKSRTPTASQIQAKMSQFSGTMDEYSGMIMQFGYVTLFAAACPIGPAIALFSFVAETRTDAYKLLRLCQRAPAQVARDIGTYQPILEFMGYVSIVTNAALVAIADNPPMEILAWRLTLIILVENLVVALKFLIAKLIPKVPDSVQRVLAKRSFILEELRAQESAFSRVNTMLHVSQEMGPDEADQPFGTISFIRQAISSKLGSIHSWAQSSKHSSAMIEEGDFINPRSPDPESSSDDEHQEAEAHGSADASDHDAAPDQPLLGPDSIQRKYSEV